MCPTGFASAQKSFAFRTFNLLCKQAAGCSNIPLMPAALMVCVACGEEDRDEGRETDRKTPPTVCHMGLQLNLIKSLGFDAWLVWKKNCPFSSPATRHLVSSRSVGL